MGFFHTKQSDGYTVILGCGRLGAAISNTISDQGGNILVIDKNRDSLLRLSSGFGGLTIIGDCTDLDVLQDAHIDTASVVIAATDSDNLNILSALLVRDLYPSPHVIARLNDPEKQAICKEHGVYTICPAALSANQIESVLADLKQTPRED